MVNPYMRQDITWVKGLEGARTYPMIPNSNMVLMDSDSDKFYIKTCDQAGMCNIRTFKYKEEVSASKDYITREEFENYIRSMKHESISRNEQSETGEQYKQQSAQSGTEHDQTERNESQGLVLSEI